MSEALIDFQRRIARERAESHRADTYTIRTWTRFDPWLVGVAGEVAWCRYLGLDFYVIVRSDRPHGDGGVDLVWRGRRVDVKCRVAPADALHAQVDGTQPTKADVLALAEFEPTTELARVVGWDTVEAVRLMPTVTLFGVTQHAKGVEWLRPPVALLGMR